MLPRFMIGCDFRLKGVNGFHLNSLKIKVVCNEMSSFLYGVKCLNNEK